MPDPKFEAEQPIPETPESRRAGLDDLMPEEEKVLAGRADANIPALLTQDVPGG